LKKYLLILFFVHFFNELIATNYFVSNNGNNSNPGTSEALPWQTMAKVNSMKSVFNPGDSIKFKRGGYFYGTLNLTRSGNSSANIVFTNYGSGNLPKWQYSTAGASIAELSYNYNVSYITFDGFIITDTTTDLINRIPQAKVSIGLQFEGGSNNTVKNCEFSLIGIGIFFSNCDNNKCINSKFYNLRMVKNTVGGDDDYGANPIVLGNSSNNIISNNQFKDCWANSYDYGLDGGGVEFFGPCSNNIVTYNLFNDCNGVGEFGSSTSGTSSNNLIGYNLIINCGLLTYCNTTGTFAVEVDNIKYYNNAIIETSADRFGQSELLRFNGSPVAATVFDLKNNIFYIENGMNITTSGNSTKFSHNNNIYRFLTGGNTNYTINSNELITSISPFTDVSNLNPELWNYYPNATSQAIDFGAYLGFTLDYYGNSINNRPEAGILEALGPSKSIKGKFKIHNN
jgi:parallel beta-helix repeat protein